MKQNYGVAGWVIAVTMMVSCEKAKLHTPAPLAKGSRQVGIHITQAESNSYDVEFNRVKGMGVDVVPITIAWNQLETDAGFDFSILGTINAYYPVRKMKVSLNLTPFAAANKAVPSDLSDKSFNDPAVLKRFRILLDSVHKKLPNTWINDLVFGVEADLYLSAHTSEWDSFKSFYDTAHMFVRKEWGDTLRVGVETTWKAAAETFPQEIIRLNELSDMMVLSYYPNQDDFTVRPPDTVYPDLQTIIGLYPSIPVFILECGYQTSADCNSSEAMQKQFISEMFVLWDAHADKISFMGFLWLTDLSDAAVDQYVIDYGASGWPTLNAFRGYLQTTGLRTYPGTGADKTGFTQLASELHDRGWIAD